MRLIDIEGGGVVTISPHESTSAAQTSMRRHQVRHLVVVDRGRVIGIVSERDFGRATKPASGELTVEDVMTTDVVSATPATTLRQAANLMRGHTVGSLLVVEGNKLRGLVTTTDLLDQLGRRATKATKPEPAPASRRGQQPLRVAPRRSAQREPLPSSLPRTLKLARGRSGNVPPPAHIRVIGGELAAKDREALAVKLGKQLGKYASSIERTTVRLSDVNGPKGGRDQLVRIKVVLSGLPSVVVEERDAAYQRAASRAIKGATVAVRRSVERRRRKSPRRKATASTSRPAS